MAWLGQVRHRSGACSKGDLGDVSTGSQPPFMNRRATAPAAPSFREIFEAEFSFVYNMLRRLGIRDAELPDATQEVFATVAAVLEDYDPSRPLRPWLFGIAFRVGTRYREIAHRRREIPSGIPDAPDSKPGADASIEQNELREFARAALSRVEPNDGPSSC